MFGFGEAKEARDEVYNYDGDDHQAKFSHELIGGAAGFEAMKAWEDHQRSEGKPVEHSMAKEVIAGFAAAEVDRLAETKGMDWMDREETKHHAKKQARQLYDEQYGGDDNYNPERRGRHQAMDY